MPHVSTATTGWTDTRVGWLNCRVRAAADPYEVTAKYASIQPTPHMLALIEGDRTHFAVETIDRWLDVAMKRKSDASVSRYVGEVLHSCEVGDGAGTELVPQPALEVKVGTGRLVSQPGHALFSRRAGRHKLTLDSRGLLSLMVQEEALRLRDIDSEAAGDAAGVSWALVDNLVLAALWNFEGADDFEPASSSVFGIRVVDTRWTFVRADFSLEYLDRLRLLKLRPDDRLDVTVWGGPPCPSNPQLPCRGLDWRVPAEREQLLRLVQAFGAEGRKLAQMQ